MRFTTKTEYGLVCLVYMARKPYPQVITVNELVKNEQMSLTYIEKIFQQLRAAEIVSAHHGKEGGYSLARPPAKINLREIVEALEGQTFDVFCAPDLRSEIVCTHFPICKVGPIWKKTKDLLDNFYSSVSLETLAHEGELERSLEPKTAG
ncbi:MAG: Rrf2 family transcriptional regulator [Candidatus Omnitrophica bacterium]|nr:Rrf2 family transcriptional regulator [Candidatus Omnitrophota bacterium]